MKFGAFKAFLPSKYLLAVAFLIGLGMLWYLRIADEQADHIVRRNFNHLNQITSNIDKVRAGLQANVFFECQKLLDDVINRDWMFSEEENSKDANWLASIGGFYRTWAQDSILVEGAADIGIEAASPALADPGPTGEPDSDDRHSHTRTTSCSLSPMQVRDFEDAYIPTLQMRSVGTILVDGGLRSEFLLRFINSPLATGDRVYRLAITQDFTLVSGLNHPEGYFDAILIGSYSADKGGKVFFNSAARSTSAPDDDIFALFNVNHDYARFSGLRAFSRADRLTDDVASALSGRADAEEPSEDTTWSAQSKLLQVSIGTSEQIAFSQPLTLSFLHEDSPVVVGLLNQPDFNRLKYKLPLNIVLVLVVLLFVGILSLSFVRLSLIPKHAVVRRFDVVLVFISLVGLALLSVVFLLNLFSSWQMNALYQHDLSAIHRDIQEQFYSERNERLHSLSERVYAERPGARAAIRWPEGSTVEQSPVFCQPRNGVRRETDARLLSIPAHDLPEFSDLFTLNARGRNVVAFATYDSYPIRPGFDVSGREYYRALRDGRAWHTELRGQRVRYYMERIETLSDGAFETAISIYLEDAVGPGVASQASSGFSRDATTACTDFDRPVILVGTTQLRSLDFTVLPPGFGFTVFDKRSGEVLFHSLEGRSRRENFYRAVDDNPELKASVVSSLDGALRLDYKGDAISAQVSPLRGTDWVLATYYSESLVDIVNFRFGAAAVAISAVLLIGLPFLIAIVGCVLIVVRAAYSFRARDHYVSRVFPGWLYPDAASANPHRRLVLFYALLLWLYVAIIYYFDLGSAWVWSVFILAGAPLAWFLSLHRPRRRWLLPFLMATAGALLLMLAATPHWGADSLAGGLLATLLVALFGLAILAPHFRQDQLLRQQGEGIVEAEARNRANPASLSWYRQQLCLFLVLMAVLPGIQLYNESFDAHERLWLNFHGWSVGDRLAARNLKIQSYASSLRASSQFSLQRELLTAGSVRGIYLPRTTLHAADEARTFYAPRAAVTAPEPIARSPLGRLAAKLMGWIGVREETPDSAPPGPGTILGSLSARPLEKLENCHPHTGPGQRSHELYVSNSRIDNLWVPQVAEMSPAFSTFGAVLKQFANAEQHASRFRPRQGAAQPDTQPGATAQHSDEQITTASWQCEDMNEPVYFVDYLDEVQGIHLMFDYFFPHTRENAFRIISAYLVMILLAAALLLLLLGFIMRRVLITHTITPLPSRSPEALLASGPDASLLLIPATVSLPEAATRVERAIQALSGEQPEYRLSLLGGAIVHYRGPDVFLVPDLFALLSDREASPQALDMLERALKGSGKTVLLSDVAPRYWLKHRHEPIAMPDHEYFHWEQLIRQLEEFSCTDAPQADVDAVRYRPLWERSTKDEKLALAALYYEGLVNARNRNTLTSLVNRGVLEVADHHLRFPPPILRGNGEYGLGQFLHDNMPLGAFAREAGSYQTSAWKSFRGPLLLALLALLCFLAYVAQEELRTVLSLLATLGAATAAVASLGERLRVFQGLFGGGNSSE